MPDFSEQLKIEPIVKSKKPLSRETAACALLNSGFSGPASVAFTEGLARSMPSDYLHCQGRWLDLMLHNHSADAPNIRSMLASITFCK